MALQFVLGSSGCGKSHYLYEHILQQSRENPDQLFFVVVPEQFTLQTQRELVQRQKNHGIMNIDVVSFQRLAYRVFDELGLKQIRVLEETGKSFVLRKVAQEKEDTLQILRNSIRKSGYINEVKSVLSELEQYRIGIDQLKKISEDMDLSAPFRYRMADLCTMYDGFSKYLEGNYVTAEEVLEVFCQEAGKSSLLKNSVILLDGFTGFTPVQYETLTVLMQYVKEMYVAVTIDPSEDPYLDEGMQDLFSLSKETIRRMAGIAKKQEIEICSPICLSHGEKSRFCKSEQLKWLEQNLFRKKMKRYEKEGNDIRLYHLPNPRTELEFVAGQIRNLVREEGYRYREIAVVCGDVQMYGNYVPEVFESCDIPYFLDRKNSVTFHSLTEMVRAVMQLLESDFTSHQVIAYLRCGLSGISMEEIDLLENYLMANAVRGKSRWTEKWVRLAGVTGMEELDRLNEIRQQLLNSLAIIEEPLKKKDSTVREKTTALYEFLVHLEVEKKLEQRRLQLEKQKKLALAREYQQIYRLVMDLFHKLVELLGDETMSLREYRQLLEAGFSASGVGIIPPGYDSVVIGDIERTRLPDIKVMFLVGVNDGLIPKVAERGGLLSEQERLILAERYGMELAPGAKERAFIQKFYLYLNLTKPSEKLFLTWCHTGGDGKEVRRSYLAGTILKLFPKLEAIGLDELSMDQMAITPKSGIQFLTNGFHKACQGEAEPSFYALLSWYRQQKEYQKQVDDLLTAAFYSYQRQWLSPQVTRELYGRALVSSVTRLEKFAACAFSHFMAYGMGLKERETGEFAPVDMGSIFHEALEGYAGKMEAAGYQWTNIPKQEQERLVTESMQEAVQKIGFLVFQDARTAYSVKRMERILKKTVETLTTQIEKSDFTPEGYEISFDFAEDLSAVHFQLSEEERMRLKGRIDRMDVKRENGQVYVKVIDYKSGNQQFQLISVYHGLQLQLVVYLNAAAEILKKKYPNDRILPAGMYYYHIDDPVVEARGNLSEEEIQKKIFEELKLIGAGQSEQDASVSRKSDKLTGEELALVEKFVNRKIRQIGTSIYRGDIEVAPYQQKDKTGCDYCPYHGVCGFDLRIPGYGYRRMEDGKDPEVILERMRKEIAHGDDVYHTTTGSH